jgi:hypothetical protein
MSWSRARSFVAGVLVANSAPHLATAFASRQHLTPLAGRRSGPVTNAVWAALNLSAGAVLLRWSRREDRVRWDEDLLAFEAGYLLFAGWMAGSERFLRVNWDRDASSSRTAGRPSRAIVRPLRTRAGA